MSDALVKARAAMAEKRKNGTATYVRKAKAPKEPLQTKFSLSDDGALYVTDGKAEWPFTVEETKRLQEFLARFRPAIPFLVNGAAQ